MPSMSYCMFQNTMPELEQCYEKLCEIDSLDELSDEEKRAARRLIKLCSLIAAECDRYDFWGDLNG